MKKLRQIKRGSVTVAVIIGVLAFGSVFVMGYDCKKKDCIENAHNK